MLLNPLEQYERIWRALRKLVRACANELGLHSRFTLIIPLGFAKHHQTPKGRYVALQLRLWAFQMKPYGVWSSTTSTVGIGACVGVGIGVCVGVGVGVAVGIGVMEAVGPPKGGQLRLLATGK